MRTHTYGFVIHIDMGNLKFSLVATMKNNCEHQHRVKPWLPRSRATSGRSILFPLGDTDRRFVEQGNLLASRLILLLWVCASRGLLWVVEQPEGSVFPLHPRWQEFLNYSPATCFNRNKDNTFTFVVLMLRGCAPS